VLRAGSKASCPAGANCDKAHNKVEQMYHPQLYKTRICKDDPTGNGKCPRGKRCCFAHGEREQRVYVGDPFDAIAKAKTGPDGRPSASQASAAAAVAQPASAGPAPATSGSKHPSSESPKGPAPSQQRPPAAALPPPAAGTSKAGAPPPSFSTVTAQQPAAKAASKARGPNADGGSSSRDERDKGGGATKAVLSEPGVPKPAVQHPVWSRDACVMGVIVCCGVRGRVGRHAACPALPTPSDWIMFNARFRVDHVWPHMA
jgi:hypothetical protein